MQRREKLSREYKIRTEKTCFRNQWEINENDPRRLEEGKLRKKSERFKVKRTEKKKKRKINRF